MTRMMLLFIQVSLVCSCLADRPVILKAGLALDAGAVLGEGAIWNREENCLYWVDIESRQLNLFYPESGDRESFSFLKRIGTVVPFGFREVALALEDGFYHFSLGTGKLTLLGIPSQDKPGNRFNDGKCDPAGRFWAGTMSMEGVKNNGALYCLDLDGTITCKVDSVSISNGIAWSPDRSRMYYTDTPTRRIREYSYDENSGVITYLRDAVVFEKGMGSPDGMTIDSEGNLWVAHWGGNCVSRWHPGSGKMLAKVEVPAPNVTSCAFGGENLDILFITTASLGIRQEERDKYPHAGALFMARPGVQGIPAFHFRGTLPGEQNIFN